MQDYLKTLLDNPSLLNEDTFVLKETHISTVLVGSKVYKFKKPIRLDFVDQLSLKSRALLCYDEWRLNRRLSPDVYLGLAFLCEKEGTLSLFPWPVAKQDFSGGQAASGTRPFSRTDSDRGDGSVFQSIARLTSSAESQGLKVHDVCVIMKHLPDEQRLEEKMETLGAADMDRLAETIATFHRNRPAEPPSHGFRSRLQNVLNTIRTVGGMDFEAALHSLLSSNRKTLNTRRFHEVDGHGDLRPDHIYLSDDAVNIIDCVEFSADIRQVDPYEDLAFATMGLRLNHRPDLARHLALSYLHRMCDVRGFLLMDLYEIYRAAVRLMVDALQLKEAGGENRADYLRRRSEAYASLIEDLISGKKSIHNGNRRQLQGLGKATATDGGGSGSPHAIGWKGPLLILLAGLPATGKSRIAALIREEGIPVLSSDVLRKKDDTRPEMRKPEAYGQGSYSSKKKMLNYRKLMCQAGRLFEKESVVCLDASFSRAQYRNLAYRMVSRSRPAMDILILQTDCSEEIIRRRLDKRKTRPGFSDLTDFDTWKKLKENFESVDLTVEGDRFHSASGARLHHLILDTSGEKRTSISPELKQMVPHLFLKRQS